MQTNQMDIFDGTQWQLPEGVPASSAAPRRVKTRRSGSHTLPPPLKAVFDLLTQRPRPDDILARLAQLQARLSAAPHEELTRFSLFVIGTSMICIEEDLRLRHQKAGRRPEG